MGRSDAREVLDLARMLAGAPRNAVSRIVAAAKKTAEIDADRWIQWSIRGGGWSGGAYRIPVDTGDYARSFRVVQVSETRIEIVSHANPRVKAGVVELGRRAAWIPIEPLSEWVRRKFNVQDPSEARSIAWLISRKASRTPRAGLEVLARARPKIAEALRRRIASEFARKPRKGRPKS